MFRVGDYDYRKIIKSFDGDVVTNPNVSNLLRNSFRSSYLPIEDSRTPLDRVLDMLSVGTYVSAGIAKGLTPNSDITVLEGISNGFRASNPFGDGYEKGEYTYSQVLDDMGWKPKSLGGKIARGVVGFAGDVLLDPTTYVTGGTSALLKGTGKAGLKATHETAMATKLAKDFGIDMSKKLSSDLPKEVYKTTFEKLAKNPSLNRELIERFATKKADDVAKKLSIASEGLTKDLAEDIVLKQSKAKGISLNADELARDTDSFMKEYNRIVGIYDKAPDRTLSLGNAPFGKKIFGKYADKSITLAKGETLQKLGDKLHIAPQYARLRNSVYGSKLGKLFSTKTQLYQLSKTDPEAVYDFLKSCEYERTLTNDIDLMKRTIYENAKKYELPPDEARQVIEMMEDSSLWSRVRKTVKLSETEEAKTYKDFLLKKKLESQTQLDELLEKKKNIESLRFAKDQEILENSEAINALRKEYKDSLSDLNISHIEEQDKIKALIKAFEDEIEEIKLDELKHLSSNGVNNSPDRVLRLYENYSKGNIHKEDVIKGISNYLYGRPDYISFATWDAHVENLVNMLKQGKSKEEITNFIEKKAEYFSGRAQTIYPFIADKMKYGKGEKFSSWKEMFWDRMNPINKKLREGKELSFDEERLFAELLQLKAKRDYWVNKFRKADTMDDVKKIITEDANKKMWNEAESIEHMTHTTGPYAPKLKDIRRKKMIDEDFASKPKDGMKRSVNKTNEFFTSKPSGKFITQSNKEEIFDDLMERMFMHNPNVDPTNLRDSHIRWANVVASEVEPLLTHFFKNDFVSLSDKQKELLYSMAMQNATRRSEGMKLVGGVNDSVKRAIAKEGQRRAEKLRVNTFLEKVKQGSTVEFEHLGKKIKGVVHSITMNDDGKAVLNITDDTGKTFNKIRYNDLKSVNTDAKLMSADEIIRNSKSTEDFIGRQEELADLINLANKESKLINEKYSNISESIASDLKERANAIKNQIKEAEIDKEKLSDAFTKADEKTIEDLSEKIKKVDEAFTNDDAFETYMRSWLGNNKVNSIIDRSNPSLAQAMLDSGYTVNEKLAKIVEQLRNDLIEIGKSEVNVGKLKPEQFETMMRNYLPHILTDDGKKIYDSVEEITDYIPRVGKKFNPHSMSRTIKKLPDGKGGYIKNPNILQINKYFMENHSDVLKGKNLFSEDIADIYTTRALKNTQILYDQRYANDILDTFGKNYTGSVEKGYNIVINHHKFQETVSDIAMLNTSMSISDDISNALNYPVLKEIESSVKAEIGGTIVTKEQAYHYKRLFNEKVSAFVQDYLDKHYTDEVRKKLLEKHIGSFTNRTSTNGYLDELSTPILKFDSEKINNIESALNETKDRYLHITKNKILDYQKAKFKEMYSKEMPSDLANQIAKRVTHMDADGLLEHINSLRKNADDIDMQRLDRFIGRIDKLKKVRNFEVKQVNDAILNKANMVRELQITKDQNRLLQLYDKFTHFIKLNQTSVLPSFHARNKMSNTFNNWLAVGSDAVNVDFQKKAFRAIKNEGNVDGVLKITHEDGSVSSIGWNKLYEIAKEHNVIGKGFFAQDLDAGVTSKGLFKKLPGGLDPTDTENFKWYKKGAEVGSLIEDQDRLIHFASQVSRGMSFEDASKSVEKYLFDYSDLTLFEQNVMKRIFPYYTWLRKNSALQLERMLENPKKYQYVAKVINGVENMVDKEDRINKAFVNDFAKDWVQLPFEVTNPDGREEKVLWNPNLPFMDLSRIPDPFNIKQSIPDMFSQTNPILKVPIEQAMNRNVFFDSPITKKDDTVSQKVGKRADHILSQSAIYNTSKDFAQKTGADLGLHLLNTVSGVKMLSYDYEKYKAMKIQELLEEMKNK